MSDHARYSFTRLFADGRAIEIPMVQRDYAQGRADPHATEVRDRFVAALHDALTRNGPPLELDFIYGRWIDGSRRFAPLDGQQRLTTLFLLHWYLACRDDAAAAFRSFAVSADGRARFSYRTRASASEFFDRIVADALDLDALPPGQAAVSRAIQDQPWFFRAWRRDATVAGCLVMLDTIDARFRDTRGLYARLVSLDDPPVVFQLLDLVGLGLSDDLYIKMNARGRPLSAFEVFKARLEQEVDASFGPTPRPGGEKTWSLAMSQRLDGPWRDFLWRQVRSGAHFDATALHLVRAVALVGCVEDEDGARSSSLEERVRALIDTPTPDLDAVLAAWGGARDALERFVAKFAFLLDLWSGAVPSLAPPFLPDPGYYDEAGTFRRVLSAEPKEIRLVDWVLFYGHCAFLLAPRDRWDRAHLHEWMRLVSNLAENSDIDDEDALVRALRAVRALLRATDGPGLLAHVAAGGLTTGFNRQQLREERIKSALILRDTAWRGPLEEAERHPYFRGQIEFLLAFSGVLGRWLVAGECDWSGDEDIAFREAFGLWYRRACTVFPPDGTGRDRVRDFGDHLWQRALLSVGDYTLPRRSNRSFLHAEDRDASWKRLLRADMEDPDRAKKRDLVRAVLEQVDLAEPADSLRAIISASIAGGAAPAWRRRLIERPEMIAYCRRQQFRIATPHQIYLLAGERRSGEHVELFTYDLYFRLGEHAQHGRLRPFGPPTYRPRSTDTVQPGIELVSETPAATCWIENSEGRIAMQLQCKQAPTAWTAGAPGDWMCSVPIEEGEAVILMLAEWLRRDMAVEGS